MSSSNPVLQYKCSPSLYNLIPGLGVALFYIVAGKTVVDQTSVYLGYLMLICFAGGIINLFIPAKVTLGPDYLILPRGFLRPASTNRFDRIEYYKFTGKNKSKVLQIKTRSWFYLILGQNFSDQDWKDFHINLLRRLPLKAQPSEKKLSPFMLGFGIFVTLLVLTAWYIGFLDPQTSFAVMGFVFIFLLVAIFN